MLPRRPWSMTKSAKPTAPRAIPENLRSAFTLNGRVPVLDWYIDAVIPPNSVAWSSSYIESFIQKFTLRRIKTEKMDEPYSGAALCHVVAFEKYMDSIRNKSVAVIGSESPWIEAILVNCGAKEVTTVEYNVPACDHPVIRAISYQDFCASSKKYDAVITYSSLEHSGLGRYGDALNPSGDLESMEHIFKNLNRGGLCFLGVPVGKDVLVWNAHRIYGPIRLKLMFSQFVELEWVGCDKKYIHTCPMSARFDVQPIIVLQKP
jgi:hypothetical protein